MKIDKNKLENQLKANRKKIYILQNKNREILQRLQQIRDEEKRKKMLETNTFEYWETHWCIG